MDAPCSGSSHNPQTPTLFPRRLVPTTLNVDQGQPAGLPKLAPLEEGVPPPPLPSDPAEALCGGGGGNLGRDRTAGAGQGGGPPVQRPHGRRQGGQETWAETTQQARGGSGDRTPGQRHGRRGRWGGAGRDRTAGAGQGEGDPVQTDRTAGTGAVGGLGRPPGRRGAGRGAGRDHTGRRRRARAAPALPRSPTGGGREPQTTPPQTHCVAEGFCTV